MRFKVSGADRTTGEDATRVVEAPSRADAEAVALRSMMISEIEVDPEHAPPAFPRKVGRASQPIVTVVLIVVGVIGGGAILLIALASLKSFARAAPAAKLPVAGFAEQQLIDGCKDGDVEAVRRAFQLTPDVAAIDKSGETALDHAVSGYDEPAAEAIATMLLARGAKINQKDGLGHTALFSSCISGKADRIVAFLVRNGADVAATDNMGQTPLNWAAGIGAEDAVTALLSAGADPSAADISGDAPLHNAAGDGKVSLISALIRAGAKVNARDSKGFTPLGRAKLSFRDDAAKLLQEAGGKE